jgi:hypothetical protein
MISDEQKHIVDVLTAVLRHTSSSPIKAEMIEADTGVLPRVISEMVAYFYSKGWPVGSSSGGFFQTIGEEERKLQFMREMGRAKTIIHKATAGRRAQANFGQITLFEQMIDCS